MTNVWPSSLVSKILSPKATGEDMNVAGTGTRPLSYFTVPDCESMQVKMPLSESKYNKPSYRIGEGTYAVPLLYCHSICEVPEISPLPPRRIAMTLFSG